MTCSNTPSSPPFAKLGMRTCERVARLSALQARHIADSTIRYYRNKRIGKAARMLKEVKQIYRNVRAAAAILEVACPAKSRDRKRRAKG